LENSILQTADFDNRKKEQRSTKQKKKKGKIEKVLHAEGKKDGGEKPAARGETGRRSNHTELREQMNIIKKKVERLSQRKRRSNGDKRGARYDAKKKKTNHPIKGKLKGGDRKPNNQT